MRFMHLLVLLCLFLISPGAFSSEGSFDREQSRLKLLHEQTKKSFSVATKEKEGSVKSKAHSGRCESLKCSILSTKTGAIKKFNQTSKSVSSTMSQKFGHWTNVVTNLIERIKYWFYKKVWRSDSFMRNNPPDAGGVYTEITTNGSRPIVLFSTDEEITDSDGSVDRVFIDFGDGSSMEIPFNELNEYGEIYHVYPEPAHYLVTYRIFDDLGASTTYHLYAETANNQLPLPTFTVDTNVGASPLTVTFTPTATDPEAQMQRLRWRFGDGQSYTDFNFEPVEHEYTSSGTYEVRLIATDQIGSVARSTAVIFVDDTPPDGGSFPTPIVVTSDLVGKFPHTVNFDASNSFDIDGTVDSYEWDFGDYQYPNNSSTDAQAMHTYRRPGTYYGRLTIRDNYDQEREFYFAVYVEGDEVYEPEITAYQNNPTNAYEISFPSNVAQNRSNTYSWAWNFDDGNSSTAGAPTNEYATSGTYTVTLAALDIHGVRHEVEQEITLSGSADSPIANFQRDINPAGVFESVEFDATGSSDPQQSDPLIYKWEFSDGTHFIGADTEEHEFEERGIYPVTLTVTNSRGISKTRARESFVIDGADPQPRILYYPKVGEAPLTVTFNGGSSYSGGAEVVNKIWKIHDAIGTRTSDNTRLIYTFNDPGEYEVDMYLYDSVGNVVRETVPVVVYDSGSIPSGNNAPNATFSYTVDPANMYKFQFDATGSSDADNDLLIYEWRVNGVQTTNNFEIADYTFPQSNIYQVELTVIDQWGASDTFSSQIDISSIATQQIVFEYSPIKPYVGQTITFGAQNSVVPGSDLDTYAWDFGDSTTGSGITASHSYASAGTYTVELTITDTNSNVFVTSQEVVVETAASNPSLKLSIRDSDFLTSVTNGGTYTGSSFPETVHLSVLGTSNANSFIRDAVWDLGNGETAYGSDVEYTYKKPGTYNISVTGYDTSNASAVATATIVVPADCKRLEGETECLTLYGLNDNIFPMSDSSWIVQATNNFSSDSLHYPKGWISLKALDGTDETVDLSDIATVSTNQVSILREKLVQQNIDFRRPYKLILSTVDSADNTVMAEIPILHFGAGLLKITVSEDETILTVTNPSAQFKKYIDMASNTEISLRNLPLGPTHISAKNDSGESVSVTVDIQYNQPANANLDFSLLLRNRKLASSESRPDVLAFLKNQNSWATKNNTLTPPLNRTSRVDWPAWAYDMCGNEPPFNPTQERHLSENVATTFNFSSSNPMAWSSFSELPYAMSKPVQLSCAIVSESLNYGFNRWKYKDGPSRCYGDNQPHWFWNWYTKQRANFDDKVIAIKYEVQDTWTTEKYSNYLVFSASDARRRHGRELADVTHKAGIPIDEEADWSFRQNYEIIIPPHFKRPQIRFEMESDVNGVDGNLYYVDCDVKETDTYPKATKLVPTAFNPTSNRKGQNAQYSLQQRYNYFPAQFDALATSAVDIDADAGKAEYEVSIQYYNQNVIDWTGVNVEFSYGSSTHSESYSFTGGGTNDTVNGIYRNTFTIDTAELAGIFAWEPGNNHIQLKITPVGEDENNDPVSGKYLVQDFIALFDAQTESASVPEICSRGYFGTSVTTFAQDIMLRNLKTMGTEGIGVRCGNMSLPFGGVMNVTGLELNTNRHGLSTQMRYFNESNTAQDEYDESNGADRKADIEAYMSFSDAAKTISEIVNEFDGMSNPTDKKKLYDFCHPSVGEPKYPCDADTAFADIDHDKVLQICQWYSATGAEIDGCPGTFLENVIRFSKWVKQNVSDLNTTKDFVMAQPTIASGAQWDKGIYKNYQKDALMLGVWPDGKPIWDVSAAGEELQNSRLAACHQDAKGCVWMKDSFVNNNYNFSLVDLLAGWR